MRFNPGVANPQAVPQEANLRTNIRSIGQMFEQGSVSGNRRGGITVEIRNGKVRKFRAPPAAVSSPESLRDFLVRQGAMKRNLAEVFCPDSAASTLARITGQTDHRANAHASA